MSRFFSILLTVLVTINVAVSQKILDKGYVKMEMTDVSSDDDQMAMALEMMKGTQTELFFNQDMYVTKMNMMGGMMEINTAVTNKDGKIDLLFNMMGQKMWIPTTIEESKKGEQAKMAENAKMDYDENDTQEILGYKCHALTITTPDQPDMKIKCYLTKDIKTNANLIQGMQSLNLQGYPLLFTVNMPNMSMTMKAVEISEKLDESKLKISTDGYKKMTFDEFQKQMGGMGGFGF